MADNPAGMQQAVQRALSEALGTIQRQLGEVQSSFEQVKQALEGAGGQASPDRFVSLLPPLVHMQASGAALAATIETVLRFVGASAQWSTAPPVAVPAYAGAPAARAAPTAVAEAPTAAPAAEAAAPAPVEEAPAYAEASSGAPAAVEAAPVDVESLPDDLKQMHQKAKRFAKVAVQEFVMYKKDEVTKGRENKDLYSRFKDEIDKSKAQYDKRFEKIASHNIDYFYDELVRVLAENDPEALGNYPYTPASRS